MIDVAPPPAGDKTAVRPFPTIRFSDAELADLRSRVDATRLPEPETVGDYSQGVPLATVRAVAKYWTNGYDWRACEAKLNAIPQFVTQIDGLDVHFVHVRSKHENALPIIVTHGWPGSFIEQLKIIGPLTDPTAHGAGAADAFHVVIPSLPGYGFSGKSEAPGWDPPHIARAWIELMKRLGYTRYVAQGGDWGNAVTELMALQAPPELLGIHTNMPAAVPADISKAVNSGQAPAGLSAEEAHAFDQLRDFFGKHIGYAIEMTTRPQTLYGIADSPVGLAAWMLDHDGASLELIARVFAGESAGLTRDDILDNVTMYWLTNTGISSARLYWENRSAPGFFDVRNVQIPVAVSAFANEIYQAPRSWAERAYPKLVYYNKHDVGGHFAAWEQTQLFSQDVRAAFRPLRGA
ncbi:MAG TPA: epoxide hydrolase [Candidatus Elarobacter sp.]|nr:epoxide hydrolase [Candidatus Elarobacter sp.]